MSPERDIHERIYNFVIRVLNLTRFLPKNVQNERIILQLIDSATSMGANDQEAEAASSKKDFILKYGIVKKETKETTYWLKVIYEINPVIQQRIKNLLGEANELLKIVSSIILSAKRKI